jgi:transcriptional regulator with PAS, ATPase and Fis domain
VLLTGETGVGKEVFARRIHELSPRNGPFVALNCGALSQQLLESELFGHEAGAFTGAKQTKPGLLETGEAGTVFLDEVGEMPLDAQVRLLRVLEERRVLRVGGLQPRPIDVRFVSATNRDLQREVAAGRFREDLYYRLNGITLAIPPLRERLGEISTLASTFIAEAAQRSGQEPPSLSSAALSRLEAHPWPGNIRELRNVVERAVVLCGEGLIEPEHLFPEDLVGGLSGGDEPQDERGRIMSALQECAGNQTRAAKLLGISRKTLGVKMDKLGIARPQKGRG